MLSVNIYPSLAHHYQPEGSWVAWLRTTTRWQEKLEGSPGPAHFSSSSSSSSRSGS